MLISPDLLSTQIHYRRRDFEADAARARLRRAARTHRPRWLTSRDAGRLRAEVVGLIDTSSASPQWSLPLPHPRRAEVR